MMREATSLAVPAVKYAFNPLLGGRYIGLKCLFTVAQSFDNCTERDPSYSNRRWSVFTAFLHQLRVPIYSCAAVKLDFLRGISRESA